MKIKKTGYEGPKCKNPTMNYPKDSHKEFCERCVKINGGCPNATRKEECNL